MHSDNNEDIGYVSLLEKDICDRCFRIKNYNEYKKVYKSNDEYFKILESIQDSNKLVLFVVDVLNIPKNIATIEEKLGENAILVLTKRDLISRDIHDEKLLNYFSDKYLEKIVISSEKNMNLDLLMDTIYKYKSGKEVYVVGFTNAGKSTLINKLIYNYSDLDFFITTSPLTSTTVDSIEIELNDDVTLIDTPGIVESSDILDELSQKDIKKVTPKKTIKPKVFQVKQRQFIRIEDLILLEVLGSSNITMFFSNALLVDRFYKPKEVDYLHYYDLNVNAGEDLVFKGLGFIKVSKKCTFRVLTNYKVDVYKRKSLI